MQTVTSASHIVDLIQQSEKKGKFVNAFNSGSRLEQDRMCGSCSIVFNSPKHAKNHSELLCWKKEFLATHRQLFVDM